MTTASVSALGKRVVELLGVKEGESIDLLRLKDGSVRLRKAES